MKNHNYACVLTSAANRTLIMDFQQKLNVQEGKSLEQMRNQLSFAVSLCYSHNCGVLSLNIITPIYRTRAILGRGL